ncbi:hypothetical protein QVD17_20607 [Tagetes erecta]|uniref:ATP-dependent RNA helicase n=1 Tax=Tagetes erecta TaxID=13708 RepID=A0AAD8KM15_TARER|nr:hypothetical protein QVD17_20607 [Tagetes erecta]
MPFKFFSLQHLRLLNSSFMKTNRSLSTGVFTRVFPHKLKYQSFNKPGLVNLMSAAQSQLQFSTRASSRNEIRSGKSLIEDEAELSDWVSELKSDSFKKSRLYSDDDDDGGDDRYNGGDKGGGKGLGFKRKRESESDGYRKDSRAKGREFGNREKGNEKRRFEGELERRNDRGKGKREGFESLRKGKKGYEDRFGLKSGGGGSVSRGSVVISDEDDEGRKDTVSKFVELISDEDDDDDDNEIIDLEDGGDDDDGMLQKPAAVKPPRVSPDGSESYLSEKRFDQCAISPLLLKVIKDAGYENMTVVQEATLPVILKGKDMLAKARTGTGKTLQFCRDQKRPPIQVLVICPTRELASQSAMEANKLIKYHHSIGVQVVIGGTRLGLEQKRMQASPCQILVATPGRLKDHIENTHGFATRLMGVKVLVLDEADHLLDMGFRKDIEKIISAVPKQRQTLLFSATVPPEVRQICHIALKRDHEYINTVREGSEESHTQVQQTHLVAPLDKHFSLLYALLKDHIADYMDYKANMLKSISASSSAAVASLALLLSIHYKIAELQTTSSIADTKSDEIRLQTFFACKNT